MSAATSTANTLAAGAGGMSVTKRLQSELMQLMMANMDGISAFPQEDNMLEWVGTITGAAGTIYAGLVFKIVMRFPGDYPYTAPTIVFTSPCYHPNVDTRGNICLDILKENWSAVYSVQTILLSLQSLLGEPNNDSPLNEEAARLWHNREAFREKLMQSYVPPEL